MATMAELKAKGYTRRIRFEYDFGDIFAMCKPDADIDGTFKAYDLDADEWLSINGWTGGVYDQDD